MKLFFQSALTQYGDADLRRFYPRDQILSLMRKNTRTRNLEMMEIF